VRALLLLLCAVPLPLETALAHRLAPSYLELREEPSGEVAMLWRTPRLVARGARLSPTLPCRLEGEPTPSDEATARVLRGQLACESGLVGTEVGVSGLAGSGTDALLHVRYANGRTLDAVLTAARPRLRIPEGEDGWEVLRAYGRLGVEHLLSGLDHVLFVLGLVALLGAGRPLVMAITAFTLGHSVTLAAASLGFVRMPAEPVEIAIAASLVALALALVRPAGAVDSSLVRHPALLPFGFGLLHGLGFAGALTAAGLPQHALLLSLFSFNVGIELGQLAVVALALPLLALLRRLPLPTSPWFCELPASGWLSELPATALGALGMYLVFDRAALWASL
jgi:hydrogenase/urease accessory protein HupE